MLRSTSALRLAPSPSHVDIAALETVVNASPKPKEKLQLTKNAAKCVEGRWGPVITLVGSYATREKTAVPVWRLAKSDASTPNVPPFVPSHVLPA
jgi:hypothetical protein